MVKDSVAAPAGQLLSFRPWQVQLFEHLLARRDDFLLRHSKALIGIPRKNGKSGQAAPIGVGALLLQPPGGEIYSCAADREQAKVVFGVAKRMIDLDPVLSSMLNTYKDVIENPTTGTIYKALSAEAYTKEGLNPSLVLFDELHAQPNRELWDVMALATGARPDPLIAAITTAGARYGRNGKPTICYDLYNYGIQLASGELVDPSFFFAWWQPRNPAAPWKSLKTAAECNPGYGDLLRVDDFQTAINTTPEAEYRTKRLNQWVNTYSSWFSGGVLEKNRVKDPIPDGARVVLVFDGSYKGDSTAILAVRIPEAGGKPRVQVVRSWERTAVDPPEWLVPIDEAEEEIRGACKRWDVVEIACDTARWMRTFQILDAEGLPVVEFPQSPQRMTPATAQTYEAVTNRQVEYVESPALERHVSNAQLRVTSRGAQLAKETASSDKKIDLAVCMVMGVARAMWHANQSADDGIWAY